MRPVFVDTSVWINHLRNRDPRLIKKLEAHEVICHPFIIGELACGRMTNRQEILVLLQSLPSVPVAGFDEIFHFIETRSLEGKGLGFIDVHLLASSLLSGSLLWTFDISLKKAAGHLGISYSSTP